MLLALISLTLVFHVVIPVLGAMVLALTTPRSQLPRWVSILAVLSYGMFIAYAGAGWMMLGLHTRWLVLGVVVVLVGFAGRRAKGQPRMPQGWRCWLSLVGASCFLCLSLLPLVSLFSAPDTRDVVRLSPPLEEGSYGVVHGGVSAVQNHHHFVRAQQHALDLVRVDALGLRASGLMPDKLDRYHIFGARVLAPCDAVVLHTETKRVDLAPGRRDKHPAEGNHVLLYCVAQDVTLLLAHMQKDSVSVAVGDSVHTGDLLGRVGNTGNTTEPHLHIHGVQGRVGDMESVLTHATPLILDFGSGLLCRNDRVRWTAQEEAMWMAQ